MSSKLFGQILTCIFLFWSLPLYANTPEVGEFLPAEIKITKVSDFNGTKLDSLRFFSKGNGKLKEIIWQADRPDESGFPQEASGAIVPRDELIFATSDLGEKASPADCDEISKDGDWFELEIEHSGRSFWVYGLNSQDSMRGAFSSDLVSYRVKDDLVYTPAYQVGFQDVGNAKSFTWSKPDDTPGENVLREISVVFSARVLFGIIPLSVKPENFSHELVALRDGPIRVVKRVKSTPRLPFGFRIDPQIVDYTFYRDSFHHEIRIKIPKTGKIILSFARFRITLALTPQEKPIELFLPNGHRFQINDKTPIGKTVLQEQNPTWVGYLADDVPVAFIAYVRFPEAEREVFQPQALVLNHTSQGSELSCLIKQELKRGLHTFSLHVFAFPKSTVAAKAPESLKDDLEKRLTSEFHLKQVRKLYNYH